MRRASQGNRTTKMCHLCRKIEHLGGIDSKLTKPIFRLISKLHKHAEPRIGDLWLWRHNETTKLRSLLSKAHKLVPLPALKALLDDVDKEIVHIQKNMPEHPPLHSTGRWDSLKISISPSESSSVRWKREDAKEIQPGQRTSNKPGKTSTRRLPSSETSILKRGPTPELDGSDIDPSSTRIQQSVRLVEDWLQKCNELVVAPDCKDDDDAVSLVSEAFGGIGERPKVESAAIWKRFSRRSWRQSLIPTKGRRIRSFHRHKSGNPHADNCIYAEPSEKLGDTEKRREQEYLMFGGRSPGQSIRYSLDSSRASPLNRGSLVANSQSSSLHYSTTTSSESRSHGSSATRTPAGTERAASSVQVWVHGGSSEVSKLRKETRQLSERQGPKDNKVDQNEGKGRTAGYVGVEAEEKSGKDTGLSDTIRRSRQRRAERAANSMPFNDRCRNDERGKIWGSSKP